jgi:hypothetical protein
MDIALNTMCRSYQRPRLVWSGWDGTLPYEQRAKTVHPYVRRDYYTSDAGTLLFRFHHPFHSRGRNLQPENQHVKFNIDVKVNNDPDHLFKLIHAIISTQPEWQTALAPRLLIGLWHPRFLEPCAAILPFCRRSFIGVSVELAREHFWACDAFSVLFMSLATPEGVAFRKECKAEGKQLCVWTVNDPMWMLEVGLWSLPPSGLAFQRAYTYCYAGNHMGC